MLMTFIHPLAKEGRQMSAPGMGLFDLQFEETYEIPDELAGIVDPAHWQSVPVQAEDEE